MIIKKEKPSIIQIAYPRGIPTAKLIARLIDKRIKVVYDAHDVEADIADLHAHPEFPVIKRWVISKYFPLIEKISVTFADYIITVSKLDRDRFIERYGITREKISVIPIGIVPPGISKAKQKFGEESRITILFHGAYSHPPNKEAVDIILRKIAPKIKHKNVVFLIAGTAMPKFRDHNVISLGYVENLDQLVSSCDIAIVPILRGGGTRVKILDYMGSSLPIVTTKKGIEGIEAENGEHAMIVDNVDEKFISAIEYLIENEDERRRLGRNARKLAEEKYDWEKIGEKLNGLYSNLM
jgi:glycosyltransferase involved in cell wall biosynthesis